MMLQEQEQQKQNNKKNNFNSDNNKTRTIAQTRQTAIVRTTTGMRSFYCLNAATSFTDRIFEGEERSGSIEKQRRFSSKYLSNFRAAWCAISDNSVQRIPCDNV